MAHNQLSTNVSLFSCNPIGQLCLGGPCYSSHSVNTEFFRTANEGTSLCVYFTPVLLHGTLES